MSHFNPPAKKNSPQIIAYQILQKVIFESRSLTEVFVAFNLQLTPLVKEYCFGVLRFYERLEWYIEQLLEKPLKTKDQGLKIWLMLGLYQLDQMEKPPYAVVSEMVNQTKLIGAVWAKNLVNAVLRHFLRQKESFLTTMQDALPATSLLPNWLYQAFDMSWPEELPQIIRASNQHAPLCLRVNKRKISRADYMKKLQIGNIGAQKGGLSSVAVYLDSPMPVTELPGFSEGEISVQDESAQLAVELLSLQKGMRVLDACAAPGGKSAHILEDSEVELTALDIDSRRCMIIQENLQRLQLRAEIINIDALSYANNHSAETFDRILLDAPCSATGVIRRHPDIKRHRREEDSKALAKTQLMLLQSLWPLLKVNGLLVYATCSLLKEENDDVIEKFLGGLADSKGAKISACLGSLSHLILTQHTTIAKKTTYGLQLLPQDQNLSVAQFFNGDGFYYAIIQKRGE